tara:strand:- start:7 stop:705 length:699 start_codon:yes stop_codon:yes gene_type:complete
MAQIFNYFPLTIFKSEIKLSEEEKNKMIKEIILMEKESKNLDFKGSTSSWTGDTQGYEFIHNNVVFENFFKEVNKSLIEYLETLSIDSNQLNIYYQRSWATISRGKENINSHKHLQSHLSFAYYLKKKDSDAKIIFYDTNFANEFLPGIINSLSAEKKKIIKKRTPINSGMVLFDAKENDIVIFPSKTVHGTQINTPNDERISISADITITAKESGGLEHLTTPLEKWKLVK